MGNSCTVTRISKTGSKKNRNTGHGGRSLSMACAIFREKKGDEKMDEAIRVELERIRDEDNRQNKRLEILEGAMEETRTLTISIHGLAGDMKRMLSEMQKQGESLEKLDNRLGALEQEPGRKWKRIGDSILDTAVKLLAGAAITGIILLAAQYI